MTHKSVYPTKMAQATHANQPIYVRLQNTKQYSGYKKRILNRKRTDPTRFLAQKSDQSGAHGGAGDDLQKQQANIQDYFESPKSKREWWRVYLHETPVPGTYEFRDFLEESRNRPCCASFKAESRKKTRGKIVGELLLPGAYETTDLVEELRKKPCTTAFKSSGRSKKLAWERSNTELDQFPVPGQYETTFPPVMNQTVSSSMFRSKTTRFKHLFTSTEGPPPGFYNPTDVFNEKKAAKSSFRSKAPRFKSSGTNVPGPGTYETDRYDRYLGLSIGQKRQF